jgi:hypothetical protein
MMTGKPGTSLIAGAMPGSVAVTVMVFRPVRSGLDFCGICYDVDHVATGPFRVGFLDLNTFVAYFNKMVVPECDKTNYNFWETP